MLESSKVGINFAGKDGFYWFIGQVTADYAWRDKNNQNVELGYRAKVRILGHHPPESAEEGGIDDEDLPWAHFLVSPQFGSGHNRGGTSFGLQGGETVDFQTMIDIINNVTELANENSKYYSK